MSNLISVLRNMRASNLMFLLVLPVIIYLLAISRNYGAAIYAVLGIEDNAKLLLGNFIIFCFSGAVGFWGALQILRSLSPDNYRKIDRNIDRRHLLFLSCNR